jgi:choline dehydrogenase-like flavoprotein
MLPGPTRLAPEAVGFRLMTEDLPRPGNRVTVDRENHPHLAYVGTNRCEAARLAHEFETMLSHTSLHLARDETSVAMDETGAGVADQAGTCRFGTDPATSVLDVHCRAHELDNLYVADASFLPSVGAVGPALTTMANAIRVGEHLVRRLG